MKMPDGRGYFALLIVVVIIIAVGIGKLALSQRHGIAAAAAGTSLPMTGHTGR